MYTLSSKKTVLHSEGNISVAYLILSAAFNSCQNTGRYSGLHPRESKSEYFPRQEDKMIPVSDIGQMSIFRPSQVSEQNMSPCCWLQEISSQSVQIDLSRRDARDDTPPSVSPPSPLCDRGPASQGWRYQGTNHLNTEPLITFISSPSPSWGWRRMVTRGSWWTWWRRSVAWVTWPSPWSTVWTTGTAWSRARGAAGLGWSECCSGTRSTLSRQTSLSPPPAWRSWTSPNPSCPHLSLSCSE